MRHDPASEPQTSSSPGLLPPRGGRYVRATITTARPTHPRLSVYVLAIAVVLVAGAMGWMKGSADKGGEAHSMLLEALAEVRAADPDVERAAAAIEATLAPHADGAAERRAEAAGKRGRMRLQRALELMDDARPETKGADRKLASALRRSAEGRLGMLDASSELLPLRERAGRALAHAEAGWGAMTRGARLSDQATAQFNRHTPDGVSRSTTLMRQSQAELASASASFASAGKAMPEADFAAMRAYADARRQIAVKSIEVDRVWLAGDVGEANTMLARLTAEQGGPLAAKARALPRSGGLPVRAAYERLSAEALAACVRGRATALEGDARLRELAASRVAYSSE